MRDRILVSDDHQVSEAQGLKKRLDNLGMRYGLMGCGCFRSSYLSQLLPANLSGSAMCYQCHLFSSPSNVDLARCHPEAYGPEGSAKDGATCRFRQASTP